MSKKVRKPYQKRRLVHGVGVNDADYSVTIYSNGKQTVCAFCERWKSILERCYDLKRLNKHPSYKGCTVCDEWLYFSKFKLWMQSQDWVGKYIDKDIIKPGNKIYSPDNCRFVSRQINLLLTDRKMDRGNYPIGVTKKKRGGYVSRINIETKEVSLGSFETVNEAAIIYAKAKSLLILKYAELEQDPKISLGLILHAKRVINTVI